jgi:hypothetical protein
VVMSSYSTTLIEASIAGKPAYIVEPMAWPDALRQEWHSLVPRVSSENEFVAVASGRAAAGDGALADWARRTMLAHGDPILRIADRIASVRRGTVPTPQPAPWPSITLPGHHPQRERLLFELRRRASSLLPVAADALVEPESRDDVAAVREVPERTRRWQPILDDYLESVERATA